MAAKQPKELNAQQQKFVDEYLLDLDATAAATRAGYSAKSASSLGYQLLQKPLVRAAISKGRADRSTETKIDAAWLLTRLALEAEADVSDLYGDNGQLLPVKEWPKIWRQGLVSGIDTDEIQVEGVKFGEVKKIRISDRVKRLELIGRHISVLAFKEVVEHQGLDSLADRLARAKKRLK